MPISDFKFVKGDEIPVKSSQMQLDTGLSYMIAPQEDLDIMVSTLSKKGIDCNESHYGGMDMY